MKEIHLRTDRISSSTMDPRIIFLLLLVFSGVFAMHRVDIPDDYVPSMRPLPMDEEKPLDLECVLILRNIVDISETKQQLTLEASFNLLWVDKNIKIWKNVTKYDGGDEKYIVMDSSYSKFIWIPDIFIDNSLDLRVPNFHTKPASIRIYDNSTIRFSKRFNFDIACHMDFANYPVDDQTCEIKFESFSYLASQLNMTWNQVKSNISFPEMKLAQFKHHLHLMNYQEKNMLHNKPFAGLKLLLHLERLLNFHILQTYIPSLLFVTLGYTSLFIPAEAVPGRITLGMLTFLALTTMNTSVKGSLPKVSYMTYMDIWVIFCLLFVFFTNLFSIIEIVLLKSGKELVGKKFNSVCKIIIPILFIVFNAIYWPVILTAYFADKKTELFHHDDE